MRIRILKQTRYQDAPLKAGSVVEVEDKTAERWIRNGIAAEAAEETIPAKDTTEQNAGDGLDEKKYAELKTDAGNKGIKVKAGTSRKQLLSLIRAADARRGEE